MNRHNFENPLLNEIKEQKPNPKKHFNPKIITLIASPFLVLLIAILAFFPILSINSLASNILDATGNHSGALFLDLIAKKGITKLNSNNGLDFLNENCNLPVNLTSLYQGNNFTELSGQVSLKIYPNSSSVNQEKFNINSNFKGYSNLREGNIYLKGNNNINLDINEILGKESNQMNTKLDFEIYSDLKDSLIVNPTEIEINKNNVSTSYKNSNWYKYNFNLPDNKKTAINENLNYLSDYIENFKPDLIFNESTLKSISDYICNNIDKITIFPQQNSKFGNSNQEFYLRPISVKNKNINANENNKNTTNLIESILVDDKFKEIIKSEYQTLSKINANLNTITDNNSSSFPNNEEQFKKDIDTAFNETRKSVSNPDINQPTDENISVSEIENIIYLNPRDLNPSAIRSKTLIVDKTNTNKIFKDGVMIEFEIFDLKYNNNADKSAKPTETKDFAELEKDFINDERVNKISQTLNETFLSLLINPEVSNELELQANQLPTEPSTENQSSAQNSELQSQTQSSLSNSQSTTQTSTLSSTQQREITQILIENDMGGRPLNDN
jgi:hypothetical protein